MHPSTLFVTRISAAFLAASLVTGKAGAHPGHGGDFDEVQPGAIPLFFSADSTIPAALLASLRNEVSITSEGSDRVIRSNGIPDHPTGQFPNRGNPNSISPQNYNFRVPAKPAAAAAPIPVRMQPFGVAVNGVVFDPGANEWWNNDRSSGWQVEPMRSENKLGIDQNNAHVQPSGAYHYHAVPVALLDRLSGGKSALVLVGWAADGFPIYGPWGHSDPANAASALKKLKSSYRVKAGTRPGGPVGAYDGSYVQDYEYAAGAGDLDECNGRTGVTAEFPTGTYHYVLTEDWPFIPRFYHGTPDDSFHRKGPPPGFGRPGAPGGPRPFGPPPEGGPYPPPF
jgi:hypothetical protein